MAEQWLNSRKLKERIIVKAKLKLLAPTHLGNGDNHSPLDMPLIQDPYEGKALLTGSSLAGALRNYVAQRNKRCARHLFGDANESVSRESYLIVDDALGELAGVELRGGVAVDPKTGTAQENHKFDIELLPAGTVFSLRFELLVSKSKEKELKQALVIALMGLQQSEICLGKRKSRGFGKCKVDHWQVAVYDVTAPQGVIAWLEENENSFKAGSEIEKLIGVTPEIFQRDICKLKTTFILRRSILIRSDMGDVKGPDMVHLKSKRFEEKEPVPVVSGTSLAGVLRSRTVKIGNEIEPGYGYRLADSLFGWRPGYGEKQSVTASRIWVEEAEIKNPIERVQTRVKIDRFSGGALTGG